MEGCRREGVEVLWDAVLGHKTAGDEIDTGPDGNGVWAVEVDSRGIPSLLTSFFYFWC